MKKSTMPAVALAAVITSGLLAVASSARGVVQNTNSSSTQNSNSGSTRNSNMSANSNTGGMSALSSQDRKFMMAAAEGGMAEVEMSRLAVERASGDAVKHYAQRMIDDHTRANTELMQVAASKGVTLPTGPNAKQRALMARLSAASGAEFERLYVREAGVKAHEQMQKLHQDEIRKGRDADAKAFAARTLPVVREHLTMARAMAGGGAGTSHGNSNSNTRR